MSAAIKKDFRTQLHEDAKDSVARHLANHTIHQWHRDGEPGRIWKCSNNGSSNMAFTVCAPPGWLVVYGDMGECAWTRLRDMLQFVRGSIRSLDYFSGKASRDCIIKEDRTELIEEWFKSVRKEWREGGRKWTRKQTEALKEIRDAFDSYGDPAHFNQALYESELCMGCDDMPNIKAYTFHYLWKIEALKWFIAKHDAGEIIKEEFSWEK